MTIFMGKAMEIRNASSYYWSSSLEKIREVRGRIRDEQDLPVLAGFEASGADYLVTGDRELRQATSKGITGRRALELLLGEFK